ncbi:hypothetical protein DY000_02015830 [Brassica cretica]|uniref:Retrotransposon gag domain-containing protein n=1 Tax=Brassica cretica TaxID=69181 RepID=A0ABQ7CLD7_BRACR|nr:hypothetical protein DY000_02015830 [Brassica cretica]
MREKATDAQTYDGEDSDSEPEPDKEASDKAVRAESPRIAHLHQMFSDRLDAMQSMRGLLPDRDLYKELTKYQCKTMEDVLSRTWAQPIEKAEGMAVSMWPDISHLSISRLELINVLRQMGQQVKWPHKMKAHDSFWNPGFWCDFHQDHGHKTEDCIALKIEVNDLLRKGHLREFLSEKAKSHLSKETTGKPTEAAPVSPPRQDRVIHVISGGSEVSGISHAAARKSTWNAKHGLEAAKPKRLLLGTDEISFTAKEQEKVLTPHHDTLVISLTVANCLVKRILVDNGSSGNIIFQAAYKDLRLEEGALTRRVTPLIVPYALGHKGYQRGSRIFPRLLSYHSERKDQGLIAITEQTSSHRGTGGRRNG